MFTAPPLNASSPNWTLDAQLNSSVAVDVDGIRVPDVPMLRVPLP
jgi:hypothetical protein